MTVHRSAGGQSRHDYRARCSCGWEGAWRDTPGQGAGDLRSHQAAEKARAQAAADAAKAAGEGSTNGQAP